MFERGFKSWCETVSEKLRKELGLPQDAPLDAKVLAAHLGVTVCSATEIPGLSQETLNVLLSSESDNWSAVTVSHAGRDCVIYNPGQTRGRWSSNVMHELAHIFIGHPPATVFLSPDGALALRSFDRQQEDEASWLAGCLLLPRASLARIAAAKFPPSASAQTFGVSEKLLIYRLNITGVTAQRRRSRR